MCKVLIILFLILGKEKEPDTPKESLSKLKTKNPTIALFLSLFPGGGQFYTENYLKGIIFGVTQTYFGGGAIYLHIQAQKYKQKREPGWEYYYDWFCNQRTNFLWWSAFVWALSMADAYVSAHFYKFDEQGKLEFEIDYKRQSLGIYVVKTL
jgi:hypothetical protein